MSSITIIIGIIVLLATLLCYAFVAQTLAHKRQKKARLLAGFTSRARNFKFMLSGFPKGFLPKELTLLVQRSLMHVTEQLTKLDPKNAAHKNELLVIAQQMTETQSQNQPDAPNAPIESPQQSQEIKACLEELYKFIIHLEASREVTRQQADIYRAMIKHLVLQLTIDGYVLHGRNAKSKDKTQLALHYFNIGLNLMLKAKDNAHFEGRITQLKETIANLQVQPSATGKAPTKPETGTLSEGAKSEWEQFGQKNDEWKKKQVYD